MQRDVAISYKYSERENRRLSNQVSKIYRGDVEENNEVKVLLPCTINDDVWIEDTGTVSSMREGMNGIFMLYPYEEDSVLITNHCSLYLKDLADFGFLDGERYAFLETEQGLLYYKSAYESLSNAQTLDDVEDYIESMLG